LLDFKTIAATPIADVAKMLGFSLAEKVNKEGVLQLVGQCPISHSGNGSAFKISPSYNRWICFCAECGKLPKRGGDCIELVRRFRKFDTHLPAAQEIAHHFNGAGKADDNPSPKQEASPPSKPSGFDPRTYLASLDAEHTALSELDILPETLIAFKAGYCLKGINRGRLAVAWHDMSGNITMFIGVALDGTIPRYLAPKGQELPYFFNVHALEEGEELRILPAVLDVMRAVESGATNVICPLRVVDNLSLACLTTLVKTGKLTVEF
jgi:hypothetical protein